MKKIKLIVCLILSLFLITGCGVEYNLSYNNSTFNENIVFKFVNNENNQLIKKYFEDNDFHVRYSYKGKYLYEKQIKEDKNTINVNLSSKYYRTDFSSSRVFDECFPTFNVLEDEKGNIIISTGKGFYCWDYEYYFTDYININFSTDYKVIQHNANKVEDNTYIWKITEDNLNDFNINLIISNQKNNNSIIHFVNDFASNQGLLLLGIIGIGILGLVIVFVVKKQQEKVNKI